MLLASAATASGKLDRPTTRRTRISMSQLDNFRTQMMKNFERKKRIIFQKFHMGSSVRLLAERHENERENFLRT